ncbi:chromosome partitioning protein ParA (plasmid) [Desulfosarcina ovata subsp. sediminis]|uniref:Chromosome partitioning protein ParA n=1 Tax=Desulfosarcina ovata subsp. sediminis TaxID=885957 RepID=A0A5K8A3E4_9BACT|nr:ParA family protein [Desulfosarcina ovata]BBO86820.1 chromosome partitioning protein ParA [Desulfosarcina ovata subsp. sediminis]
MPVIVFASSKGGAGKTTAAVVLACELARQGKAKNIGVSLIDADPNQHSAAWAKLDGKPDNIALFENVTEDNILDVIEEAQQKTPFVLVDLEGVASSAVVGAVSRADLVIIPCQPSQNDAKEAAKTIKTIKYGARISGREIPFSVMFTRLSAAIITKTGKHLAAEFDGAGVDVFKCSLIDREAFKSIFSFGGTVNDLEASSNKAQSSIDKAAENARLFAEEVKQHLKRSLQPSKQEVA